MLIEFDDCAWFDKMFELFEKKIASFLLDERAKLL